MKSIKQIFIALALLCITPGTQVMAEPIAGKDYTVVNPAQSTNSGKKIEVLEFFFYGCSHCYTLHPFLESWEKKKSKDVEFVLVPTIFSAQPTAGPVLRSPFTVSGNATFCATVRCGQIA